MAKVVITVQGMLAKKKKKPSRNELAAVPLAATYTHTHTAYHKAHFKKNGNAAECAVPACNPFPLDRPENIKNKLLGSTQKQTLPSCLNKAEPAGHTTTSCEKLHVVQTH